jgi:hypothetical protein
MANQIYLAHLEDLLDEARINPNFDLVGELAALREAIAEGSAA